MLSRRHVRGRAISALLLGLLVCSTAGGSVSAGPPAAAGQGAGPAIRGQLAGVVAAARAGSAGRNPYAGLLTATTRRGEGVAVSLTLDDAGATGPLRALLERGARIVNRAGLVVEAYLPEAALAALPDLDGIAKATPILRPVPLGSVRLIPLAATGIGQVGEGVAIHGADQWQSSGVTGSGVKVGIIDGGFVGLTSRLARELPAAIHARCYREIGFYSTTAKSCEAFTEHGTAVAETIADMAPGASLYLADPISQQDLESTIAWMTSNGVRVINLSLGYAFEGPGDGTGPPGTVYSAVNQAVKGGALWVNAAGNSAEDGWVGPWADPDGDNQLDFAAGEEGNAMTLVGGDSIVATLRWNDPWGKSANDYDLFLYGPSGADPVASSEDPQRGAGSDPVESFSFTASSSGVYRLVIRRASGKAVTRLQLLVLTSSDAALQYRTVEGTLPSPADSNSPGSIAVGAVDFEHPEVIEPFSSRGPTLDGRVKPDLVAVDCTTTSTLSPFCGTSVASPYAAGAAALVLAARPTLTPAALASWLRDHAVPLGSPVPNDTFGYGRLALGPPPAPPAPTALAFASQPEVAVVGVPLYPVPAIRILDQDGQAIESGPGSTASVTLALGGSTGGMLACPDGLTRHAVAGVATFPGCTVSSAGSGVTLVATSGALPAATSAAFEVEAAGSPPSPNLTLDVGPSRTMLWGGAAILSAALAPGPASPLAGPKTGRDVRFEASRDGTTWQVLGHIPTDTNGSATLSYRPATNVWTRATFSATPDLGAATSSSVRVNVRQLALLRPTNSAATKTIPPGRTIAFTTLVRPARADLPAGTVVLEVWRRVGGKLTLVESTRVQPDAGGAAVLDVTFGSTGTWLVRAMASPTRLNANSLWTPWETFRVV